MSKTLKYSGMLHENTIQNRPQIKVTLSNNVTYTFGLNETKTFPDDLADEAVAQNNLLKVINVS